MVRCSEVGTDVEAVAHPHHARVRGAVCWADAAVELEHEFYVHGRPDNGRAEALCHCQHATDGHLVGGDGGCCNLYVDSLLPGRIRASSIMNGRRGKEYVGRVRREASCGWWLFLIL